MNCTNCPLCSPSEATTQLPFSEDRQDAVLGHLLTNHQFFIQAKNRIKPTWFKETECGQIYAAQLHLFEKYRRQPTIDEVKAIMDRFAATNQIKNKLIAKIAICVAKTQTHGLDIIRTELTEWLHSIIYQESIEKSVRLYNSKKTHESYEHIKQLTKDLQDIKFDDGEEVRFDNITQSSEQVKLDYSKALTMGLHLLDKALLTDASVGGLLPGDMTILLAPVNIGKTTTMITVIKHNINAGKKVLFMTHEGRPNDIRNKLLCSVANCTMGELMNLYQTPEGLARLEEASQKLSKFLTYVPYNKPGMTIEDVEPIIRRYQENCRISSPDGKGYDLLVVDYPAKLTTVRASKGMLPQRVSDHIVYEYYTQLALEYNFHVLCAIQTNREGSRVNQGKDERFLTMEDVNESWGPMQSATNVISLNRDLLSQLKGVMTFYVCKSRASQVGTAVVAQTDFAHATTHSNNMLSAFYFANAPMSDRIDALLAEHNGVQIPDDKLEITREFSRKV